MATNKHIIQIQTKGAKKSEKDIKGISGGLSKMAMRAAAAAAAFYAAKGIINGISDLAKQAVKIKQLERGFDNLGSKLNFNESSFNKLNKAVNGTMKQVDLMTKANNAMMLGVVESDEEMAQLFDTAQRLGQALGIDTVQSIDSMVTGMGRQCLTGDSVVSLENGNKKIKDIKKGDIVLSYHKDKGFIKTEVSHLLDNGIQPVYETIFKDGKKITSTDNHRFLTDNGWKELKDIEIGGLVLNEDGKYSQVKEVNYLQEEQVYDLTVPETANFFANGLCVHNSKLMLDNLGIMIDTEKAYEDYAAVLKKSTSELTESERKTAFNNAVLEESARLVSGLGAEVEDGAMVFQQLTTSLNTAANEIGLFLSPAVVTVAGYFRSAADTVSEFFGSLNESDADSVIEKLSALGGFDETIQSLKKIELQKQLKDINLQIKNQGIAFKTSEEAINAINAASEGTSSVGESITRDLTEREDRMNKLLLIQDTLLNLKDAEFDAEGKISILNEASGKSRKFTYNELIAAEMNYRGQLTMREGQRISELQLEKELLDFKQLGLVASDDILANADEEFDANVKKIEAIEKELELLLEKENIEKRISEGKAASGSSEEEEISAKDLWIQTTVAELELKQKQVSWNDELIEQNKDLAKSLGLVNSVTRERENLARQDVANLQLIASEYKEFSGVAKAAAIAQTTFDTYKSASSLFKKYSETYPPPAGEILGGISAGLAVAGGLARVQQIRKAQYGANFVTDGPQMMMVGEGSGPERVQVTPLDDPNIDGPQGQGITLNISGNVLHESFVEDNIIPQIREGLRLGENMGI